MIRKVFILNLLVVLLFVSCEKEVKFGFEHQPKLNLICILNPDSTVTANLTLSKSLDSPARIKSVDNAVVTLYEEDNIFGALERKGNGQYGLDKKPREGKKYKITAEAKDYSPVFAETTVPNRPVIQYTKEITGYLESDNGRALFDLHVKIEDKPGKDNYWVYESWVVNRRRYAGVNKVINTPYLDSFNKRIDTDSKYGYTLFLGIRLSDEGYDGQLMEFTIADFTEGTEKSHTEAVYFLNTEEYYDKYIKTSIINRMKETSELPFFEPVQIYSNVKGGYGIFGAGAITKIKLYPVRK